MTKEYFCVVERAFESDNENIKAMVNIRIPSVDMSVRGIRVCTRKSDGVPFLSMPYHKKGDTFIDMIRFGKDTSQKLLTDILEQLDTVEMTRSQRKKPEPVSCVKTDDEECPW